MRFQVALLLFALAACIVCGAQEHSRAELIQRAHNAKLDEQPRAYADVAKFQLHQADKLYAAGNSYGGRAAVQDVATFSAKAADAAIHSRKRMKDTEISIRKMAEKLQDIKTTVDYPEEAPIQSVINQLETLRNQLLDKMFDKQSK